MLRLIRRHPVKLLALTGATLIGVACSNDTTTENSQPQQAASTQDLRRHLVRGHRQAQVHQRRRRHPVPDRQDDSLLELELHRSDQRGHLSLHHGRHQPVHHQRQHHSTYRHHPVPLRLCRRHGDGRLVGPGLAAAVTDLPELRIRSVRRRHHPVRRRGLPGPVEPGHRNRSLPCQAGPANGAAHANHPCAGQPGLRHSGRPHL